MTASVRAYLVLGASAAIAITLAFTAVQPTPHDIAVPAHPTSAEPHLSQAMVDLLASAGRMTIALLPQAPATPTQPGLAPVETTGTVGALLGGFPGLQDAIIREASTVAAQGEARQNRPAEVR